MIERTLPKEVPLPFTHGSSHTSSSSVRVDQALSFRSEGYKTKKRKGIASSPLEKAFNLQQREKLDDEIARIFFSAGLPFNLARNPHYKNAFIFACNNNLAGYVPPSYIALRSKLLEREIAHIETLLEPTKGVWKEKGVSLVCDGWTDPQRKLIINFMVVTKNYPMFIKAVNCEEEYKDKHLIVNLIKEIIVMIGPSNVVQVITDNAPVCRAAGLLVEQTYPHIFWTPCVVHTLNLALKSPQKDLEVSNMRKICLKRYFPNEEERRKINIELAKFFGYLENFGDQESLVDRWRMDPNIWWLIHGASAPLLQIIAIKLLG
ncbi:hypothetical protein MA16_Dca021037 [Dendrobium catenatum]|uniref:DUF659 domain-containing protein n=1 Tax=Dendrobium catenatum TaxID=906689 RepID=A0A2I0W5H8_9ASPA|nr:hypothetical protein MA16_Dca021037 [Dendrobium catenatum]